GFFTVTGWHLDGTPTTIEPRQAELTALWCELFGAKIGDHVWLLDDHGTITNHDGKPWAIVAIKPAPSGEPYAFFAETASGWALAQCEAAPPAPATGTTLTLDDAEVIRRAITATNQAHGKALAHGQWQQQ